MRYRLRRLAIRVTSGIPVWLRCAFFQSFDREPDIADDAGYNVIERIFYTPLPDARTIGLARLCVGSERPGIELNFPGAAETLAPLVTRTKELNAIPELKTPGTQWKFDNGSITHFRAALQKSFPRGQTRPQSLWIRSV